MSLEVLLVQFLILAFTGIVWWLARRDLASRAAPAPASVPPDTQELEQLCATLEALVSDLAERLEDLEQKLQESGRTLPAALVPASAPAVSALSPPGPIPSPGVEALLPSAPRPPMLGEDRAGRAGDPLASPPEAAIAEPENVSGRLSENVSHTSLYALLDDGVTDPVEIARRTGLGRGEVDLIMNLRSRRAL